MPVGSPIALFAAWPTTASAAGSPVNGIKQAFDRGELFGPLGIDRGRRDKFGALPNLLKEGVYLVAHRTTLSSSRRNSMPHPAANRALRYAITARLARLRPAGDAVFAADELPANRILTSSVDPENIGTMIEAFDFRTRRDTKEADAAYEKVREELREKYPELRKDHEL
jgi:hypothetical protein